MRNIYYIIYKEVDTIDKFSRVFGFFSLLILLFLAIFGSRIVPYNPFDIGNEILLSPNKEHLFGTDGLGRDVFSMVIFGTKTSLIIGLSVSAISTFIGITIGGLAGYIGGKFDKVVSEIMNILMVIPQFFFVLLIFSIIGNSFFNIVIILSITAWTGTARFMRSQVISLKENDFIISAKAFGKSDLQIFFEHIVPSSVNPIIPVAISNVATSIMTESSLAFLGIGDPNNFSWGQIVNDGSKYFFTAWWISAFSGLAITVTIFTFVMIGEGIHVSK